MGIQETLDDAVLSGNGFSDEEFSNEEIRGAAGTDVSATPAGESVGSAFAGALPAALDEGHIVVGSLRRDEGGWARFLTSLATVHTAGVDVDWDAVPATAGPTGPTGFVDLPTYPFQRDRYWLNAPAATGDVTAAGLGAASHPLLNAVVPLADGDGLLLTGRLSLRTHSWLADHAVFGNVLLPGTAFVELALRAGDEVACREVQDLTLEAPLVLPEQGDVQIQLAVDTADPSGRRALRVYARSMPTDEGTGVFSGGEGWARHATAWLAPGDRADSGAVPDGAAGPEGLADLAVWPPADARAVDLSSRYEQLAAQGYEYGPGFQGLTALWRRGDETFAEVRLAEEQRDQADLFGIHPALLDAALHAVVLRDAPASSAAATDGPRLPFAWDGVRLLATGARTLRVRFTPKGEDTVRILAADTAGEPVAVVDSLSLRTVTTEQLAAAAGTNGPRLPLYRVEWQLVAGATAVAGTETAGAAESVEIRADLDGLLLGASVDADGTDGTDDTGEAAEAAEAVEAVEAVDPERAPLPEFVLVHAKDTAAGTGDAPEDVHAAVERALDLVQTWLADPRTEASRLVFVSQCAVHADGVSDTDRNAAAADRPADADPGAGNLADAAVWGLLRTALTEHPGRFALLDVDVDGPDLTAIHAEVLAASVHEPQLALREGALYTPRIVRADLTDSDSDSNTDMRVGSGADVVDPLVGVGGVGTVVVTGGTGTLG
ncbi:polyketide synthase dehydratase domain-containing protein, partial [Streptomyces sp. NPDC001948]